MRTILAIAIVLAGTSALPAADRPGKAMRKAKPPIHTVQPRYHSRYYYRQPGYYPRAPRAEDRACQEAAEAEDPAGVYRGYPCWARSTFGRGSSGGRR
jgi:hypothetical protein